MKSLLSTLAVLLALSACAKPATNDRGVDGLAHDREVATTAGQADLDFSVATVDGGTFDGKTLAGRPAVLWFWAPWCATCAAEAPAVRQAADRYRDSVAFVGVAGLGDVVAMRQFVERSKVDNFPQLADDKGVVWKRFGVTAQSTFVVLNDSGQVVFHGYLDEDELGRELSKLAG